MIIPWATWYPGPTDKINTGARWGKGAVLHSSEGSLDGALRRLMDPTAEVSWTFTNALDGRLFQHYNTLAQCWHAHAYGNVRFIGIEHENAYTNGRPNHDPITDAQLATDIRLLREIGEAEGWDGYVLRDTLWEHNWIPGNSTQCPSGRIRWDELIAGLAPSKDTPLTIGVYLRNGGDQGTIYQVPAGDEILGIGANFSQSGVRTLWQAA